jgi:electron transport complex protein RnfG
MSADDLAPEPSSTRLVATLAVAGLLAGLLLASVYALTLPAIEANAAEALRRAVFQVVPGTTAMRPLTLQGERYAPPEMVGGPAPTDTVYAAYGADGRFLGYALPAAGPGFQDTIKLLYGYDPVRGLVVGMRVLESRETPGLGDKIFKDPAFKAEFDALALEPEAVVVKHGQGSAQHHVDGITGATISSKAVVRVINLRHRAVAGKLPSAAEAPPAPEPELAPEEDPR